MYWSMDTFGPMLPENWEKVVETANTLIEKYAETHDKEDIEEYLEKLWETYCEKKAFPVSFYGLEVITDGGDIDNYYFYTKEDAIDKAEQIWYHLTDGEKSGKAFYIHTYSDVLMGVGEDLDDLVLRLIDDNALDSARTNTEDIYSTEGDLMGDDDSLGWCAAHELENGEAVFVTNEGTIDVIRYKDGKEISSPSAADIEALARKANPNYEEYGWKDEAILMDAPLSILPCRSCPWFSICDAMCETRGAY